MWEQTSSTSVALSYGKYLWPTQHIKVEGSIWCKIQLSCLIELPNQHSLRWAGGWIFASNIIMSQQSSPLTFGYKMPWPHQYIQWDMRVKFCHNQLSNLAMRPKTLSSVTTGYPSPQLHIIIISLGKQITHSLPSNTFHCRHTTCPATYTHLLDSFYQT